MAIFNACPPGSFNPSNPSNPYSYPMPTCSIRVSQNTANAGQPVMLQWQSQNALTANLSSVGQVGPSGSMTVYPQGPTTYVMTLAGYGNQQGRCEARFSGDQRGGVGAPTAQISCASNVADVGMKVAISYACQNASSASATGFSTGGSLSGSSEATIDQSSTGISTQTYGLTCAREGQTHSAQCSVQINKPSIVLVASPATVKSGEQTTLGWVTGGMNSCVISSPTLPIFSAENEINRAVSGTAKSPVLVSDTEFVLTCTTKSGATRAATTTVEISH